MKLIKLLVFFLCCTQAVPLHAMYYPSRPIYYTPVVVPTYYPYYQPQPLVFWPSLYYSDVDPKASAIAFIAAGLILLAALALDATTPAYHYKACR